MNNVIYLIWSMASVINFIFSAILANMTLTSKYKKGKMFACWMFAIVVDYLAVLISYKLDINNDVMSAIGQCVILCIALCIMYTETPENKIFIGLTMPLIASVSTFLFCGTADTILGAKMNLFDPVFGPYTVGNILLFSGIKVIVFFIIGILYYFLLKKQMKEILAFAEGQMKNYLVAPAISIVGFFVINLVTNATGIVPTSTFFLPLYLTICLIFIVEYIQIFSSIRWTVEAKKAEKEKERIGAELNVATQIQADMLPRIFPAFPERKEFDLHASMDPAKEVGGDFYDFFLIDDDHIGLVMADVSGKGVPAALFMVIAKTLIKNQAQIGGSPAEVLAYVNDQLCEGNDAELFVTVWLGIIEISTGKGMAANAGHEHPVIRRAGGKYEMVKYRHSPAVATLEGIKFKEHEFELKPGDSLFVYTDGVPEATNFNDEMFGTDRMLAALNRNINATPKEALMAVKDDISAFVGEAPQFDDITMLGFSYFGNRG